MRTKQEIFRGEDEGYFLLKCQLDPLLWFERVLGMDIQEYHKQWISNILDKRFVCIQAHRGSGKTFVCGFGIISWLLWFGRPDKPGEPVECLITSAALEQSTKTMQQIMLLLKENALLAELVPQDKTQSWSKTVLSTVKNDKVYCKAYGPGIRGYHVDYVLCDEAGEYRDHDVFNRSISPTVNNKKGKLIVIGTPTSQVDLLQKLSKNKQYWHQKYPVYKEIDGKRISLWPTRFSLEEIENIRTRDGEASFQREYLLNPKAEAESALFPAEMIAKTFDYDTGFSLKRSYEVEETETETEAEEKSNPERVCFMGCDFAIAQGPRADFDSYVIVEKVGNHTNILFGERHKGMPIHGKVQRIKELYERYRPRRIICDQSNIGQAIIERLKGQLLPVQGQDFAPHNRNHMLIILREIIEDGRLSIPRNEEDPLCMTFTDILITELVNFSETKTPSGLITYKSKANHDDTVMSLCLAIKGVHETKEFLDLLAI